MDTMKILLLIILTCYYPDIVLSSGKKDKGKQVTVAIHGALKCPGYEKLVVEARLRQPNFATKIAKKLVKNAKSAMTLGKVLHETQVRANYLNKANGKEHFIISGNVPPKMTKFHIELKPIINTDHPFCKHIIEVEIPFKSVKNEHESPNGHHNYVIDLGTCDFVHGICDGLTKDGIHHKPKTQTAVGGPNTRENIDSYEIPGVKYGNKVIN